MSLGKVFINGIYNNLKRIIFGSECRTDLQLREDVLNGNVKPSPKVAEVECIGCGGCSNVCPTMQRKILLSSKDWLKLISL